MFIPYGFKEGVSLSRVTQEKCLYPLWNSKVGGHPLWISREVFFTSCGFKRYVFYHKLFLFLFVISLFLVFELIPL